MKYDVFMVGVGGQGILTIGEILSSAALVKDLPVNFYPSKGMAQRGGFVKAQLRLGNEIVGPNIPECGADLVLAMEVSEALKAIRYVKPGGDFVLFGDVWAPTAVMLGKAGYPTLDAVLGEVKKSGAKLIYLNPQAIPFYKDRKAADNIFMLGATLKHTALSKIFTAEEMDHVIQERWKKAAEANRFALQAGLDYKLE
jgi:indolepyruvate ferredoxin oxidoreductase, beta subunit